MGFSKITGHEVQIEFLRNSVLRDRVAHAYLFSGPDGIGKKLVATEFAKLINCSSRETENENCDCSSCVKTEKGLNPDVRMFEYPGEKTIKVDNVRKDIEHLVYLAPYENPCKVFIIDGAQRMNINAQNAFLKTLEEPPANSVIILITTLADLLMPTIRSRCQTVAFNPLETERVKELLQKKRPEIENPELVSKISSGSIAKALDTNENYLRKRTEYIENLMKIDGKRPLTLFDFVERIKNDVKEGGPEELKLIFDILSTWLRDSVVFKISEERKEIVNTDLLEQLSEYSEKKDLSELMGKFAVLEQTISRILNNNANLDVSFENLLLKLSR